jgi:hypothetical protein
VTVSADRYPVLLEVEPPAPQRRWTVLLRFLLAIPHLFVLFFLSVASAVVSIVLWFAILFTGRAPAGMLRFLYGVQRWSTRVSAYMYLLTDRFPPFSLQEEPRYPVRLTVDTLIEPRNRLTVAFRIILALPQSLIVGALGYLAQILAFLGWFAALFTGSMPLSFHDLIVAVLRWQVRVNAYSGLLVDRYPPFEWDQAVSG